MSLFFAVVQPTGWPFREGERLFLAIGLLLRTPCTPRCKVLFEHVALDPRRAELLLCSVELGVFTPRSRRQPRCILLQLQESSSVACRSIARKRCELGRRASLQLRCCLLQHRSRCGLLHADLGQCCCGAVLCSAQQASLRNNRLLLGRFFDSAHIAQRFQAVPLLISHPVMIHWVAR